MRHRYNVCLEVPVFRPRPQLNRRATRLRVADIGCLSLGAVRRALLAERKRLAEIRRLWASPRIRIVVVDTQTGEVIRREKP